MGIKKEVKDKSYVLSNIKELNDGVTELYESLMDDEIEESVKIIDDLYASLRHLKSNLLTKKGENEI